MSTPEEPESVDPQSSSKWSINGRTILAIMAAVIPLTVIMICLAVTGKFGGGDESTAAARPAPPSSVCSSAKLNADGAAEEDQFGTSVAVSGETAVIGAPQIDVAGPGFASVYSLAGTTMPELATRLSPANGADGDFFGASVAVRDGLIVVGAPQVLNDGPGYVAVYARDGGDDGAAWRHAAQLAADGNAAAGDFFGRSVAVHDGVIVVGATQEGNDGRGYAVVFDRSGVAWKATARLTAADAATLPKWARFGWTVAVHGDVIVVGAPGDDDGGPWSGAAYVFVRTGGVWEQTAKVVADDAAAGDEFGWSVGANSDTIVVAAPYDRGGLGHGTLYVFVRDRTAWTQVDRLVAADAAFNDRFGYGLSLYGDALVVGAEGAFDGERGAAYLFVRRGMKVAEWKQMAKFAAEDGAPFDYFGLSVAISGRFVVVGSYGDDDHGSQSGSAYIFELC